MRIIVCGGRDYHNQTNIWDVLTEIHLATPITLIMHGGATGADAIAASWGIMHGVVVEEFLPDWRKYGTAAGPKRNGDMIKYGNPDLVVAFPGGNGTTDMVAKARQAGITVRIVS